MHIGIDIRPVLFTRAGISRYTAELAKALVSVDKVNRYSLLTSKRTGLLWHKNSNGHELILRLPQRWKALRVIWESALLPAATAALGIDLVHFCRSAAPAVRLTKTVVTIHDLAAFRPEPFLIETARKEFKEAISMASKRADLIITPSESTKADLISHLSVPEKKIRVIPEGVSANFRILEDVEIIFWVKAKYTGGLDYIMCCGTLEPRKNYAALVKAYARLKAKIGFDLKLLVVGQKGWRYDDIFEEVERHNLAADVIFADYVPEEELIALYNGASVFICPSLYEGFGLPIIEAMACGAPVVASNLSSLPEVAGGAAILVDPLDFDEMASAIGRCLTDQDLRGDLTRRGFERVKSLSWESTARKTLKAYMECAG